MEGIDAGQGRAPAFDVDHVEGLPGAGEMGARDFTNHFKAVVPSEHFGQVRVRLDDVHRLGSGGPGACRRQAARAHDQQYPLGRADDLIPEEGESEARKIMLCGVPRLVEKQRLVSVGEQGLGGRQGIGVFKTQAGRKAQVRALHPVDASPDAGDRRRYAGIGKLQGLR